MDKPEQNMETAIEDTNRTLEIGNEFRRRVANRYNEWLLSSSQTVSEKRPIFVPNGFVGDWSLVPREERACHMISVFRSKDGEITTEEIENIFGRNHEVLTQERVLIVREAYRLLNERIGAFGMTAGAFDNDKIFFLPEARIVEIAGGRGDALAYPLTGFADETLIPSDNEDLNRNNNQLFDVVVHELGHQVRTKKGLDVDANMLLEEGIVQSEARGIEIANNKQTARTDEVYLFQSQVVNELAKVLGVPSLFDLSHKKIRELIIIRFSHFGLVSEPYDDLVYDMSEVVKQREEFISEIETTNVSSDRIVEMNSILRNLKNKMNQRWDFKL